MSDIIRNAVFRTTYLPPQQESQFQDWYSNLSRSTGLASSPDDPEHHYDWRAMFQSGEQASPNEDGDYHWPSQHKTYWHPNKIVDGMNTRTGRPAQ